jgi:hypothetical protein
MLLFLHGLLQKSAHATHPRIRFSALTLTLFVSGRVAILTTIVTFISPG